MNPRHKLWSADFVLLLAVSLLAFITCQGLNNGTPLYVTGLGGSTGFAGLLILEFSACAAVARISGGRFIDAGKRRNFIIAGAVILLVGTAGALVLPGVLPQVAFRALQGVGFGLVTTASSTAAADVLPSERLGEGIGYFGLGQSLGMAIGPSLAVLLTTMVYRESLYLGLTAVVAALIIFALCCRYESHPDKLSPTSAYKLRWERGETKPRKVHLREEGKSLLGSLFEVKALVGAAPMLVICIAFAIPTSYTALYASQLGLENPGLFFVFAAITMTAIRLGMGSLLDRLRPIVLYTLPIASGVIMFLMLALTNDQLLFYLAGAFFGVSMGLAFPLLNGVTIKNTDPARWGAANALFYLTNDLGVGFGAVIWGIVADNVGYIPVMIGGACTIALSYFVAVVSFPKKEKHFDDEA